MEIMTSFTGINIKTITPKQGLDTNLGAFELIRDIQTEINETIKREDKVSLVTFTPEEYECLCKHFCSLFEIKYPAPNTFMGYPFMVSSDLQESK